MRIGGCPVLKHHTCYSKNARWVRRDVRCVNHACMLQCGHNRLIDFDFRLVCPIISGITSRGICNHRLLVRKAPQSLLLPFIHLPTYLTTHLHAPRDADQPIMPTCKMEPPATPPFSSSTSDPGLLTSKERMTIIWGGDTKSLQ
jgi:hypothetical protein